MNYYTKQHSVSLSLSLSLSLSHTHTHTQLMVYLMGKDLQIFILRRLNKHSNELQTLHMIFCFSGSSMHEICKLQTVSQDPANMLSTNAFWMYNKMWWNVLLHNWFPTTTNMQHKKTYKISLYIAFWIHVTSQDKTLQIFFKDSTDIQPVNSLFSCVLNSLAHNKPSKISVYKCFLYLWNSWNMLRQNIICA